MFYTVRDNEIFLSIRLTPKAAKNSILGVYEDARGAQMLKISVTAPAEDNKANTALVVFLAKKLKIAKSQLSIIQGATHRNKCIQIKGINPTALQSLYKGPA
ncbi:DUF167 domain-containing protein [Candidatus Odyssella acanthamoebae]|uniref:UPF0235 protein ID47_09100 n=1 Tax=Candidatus Odyssella acanthamoebae TaxID=91604 RepID=A0A077B1N5_9PROT|nr:DUF167 domain-containing protein [Candidatus Paracaedibacter acanthamoebae]AIK96855.1 hypothetical protein ID47_09100 [Candidatus Paracaedibacter acanthamoebae]